MPLLTDEPALGFWLRYAERAGALVEDRSDCALVLLPDEMRVDSELSEEATVTANPDVAREDGAILMIAGHPEVERAAGAVLAEADTGYGYLPWPSSRPPARSTLEAHARDLVSVEHGRIDAAGEPIAAYLPLLRVGAMVSYAASLTLRFQEQEEVCVDGRTGAAVGARLLSAVRDRALLPNPDAKRRKLEPDLSVAIPAAHAQLEARALARQGSLGSHARRALDSELARANAYYASALESIARRRANAAPDRVRLLDSQSEATRAERDRRCHEIEAEHQPRHELRPFRLHLVHLPAFVLAVDVRRGARRFAFELTWVPGAGEFAAARCPACGALEPLVATRERLGCGACTTPSRACPPRATDPSPTARTAAPSDDSAGPGSRTAKADQTPPGRSRRAEVVATPPAADGARRHRSRAPLPAGPSSRGRPVSRQASPEHVKRTGNKLAFAFWECVANGGRWPRSKTARESPLRAVCRLYGSAGPLCAIGAPGDQYLEEITACAYPGRRGAPALTLGNVKARGEIYPYAMFWWVAAGKPVVGEVMPAPHPLVLPPRDGETAEIGSRLREGAPAPTVALDPVSSLLWRTELEDYGLPLAIRCLATWWRVMDRGDPIATDEAVAGAVARAVAGAAQIKRTLNDTATMYRTDPRLLTLTEHAMKGELCFDPARGW